MYLRRLRGNTQIHRHTHKPTTITLRLRARVNHKYKSITTISLLFPLYLYASSTGRHKCLNSSSIVTSSKLFLFSFPARNNRNSQQVLINAAVQVKDVQNLQTRNTCRVKMTSVYVLILYLFLCISLNSVGSVAFLPQELPGTKEWLRVFELPALCIRNKDQRGVLNIQFYSRHQRVCQGHICLFDLISDLVYHQLVITPHFELNKHLALGICVYILHISLSDLYIQVLTTMLHH